VRTISDWGWRILGIAGRYRLEQIRRGVCSVLG
jgi:hypothetical protein